MTTVRWLLVAFLCAGFGLIAGFLYACIALDDQWLDDQ